MFAKLKLTKFEMEQIINNQAPSRIKITFNDVPICLYDIDPDDEFFEYYNESDGREYRLLMFTDLKTNFDHSIGYIYHHNSANEWLSCSDTIQIVDRNADSNLYIKEN